MAQSIAVVVKQLNGFVANAPKVLQKIVRDESAVAADNMRGKFVPYPTATKRQQLNARRGELMRAIGVATLHAPDSITAQIGVLNEGVNGLQRKALVQEFGAYGIRPVHGAKKLAIPINEALNSNGVPRYFNVRDAKRDYVTFPTQEYILGRPVGGGPVTALFKREESVDVPPTPFIRPELDPLVTRVMNRIANEIPGVI